VYEKSASYWGVPAIWAGSLWIGLAYAYRFYGEQLWQLLVMLVAAVASAWALANLWEYITEKRQWARSEQQHALSLSSDVRLFEEATKLAIQAPELAAEMAHRIGRPDLILFPSRKGRRAQIKLAGSEVTLQFALEALRMSDDTHYVAQRNYLDSTHSFDPNRDVTDRQQWMQFNWILAQDGMCQRYVPGLATNTAPMWLPPWTPQRVLDLWLLPDDLVETLKPFIETATAGDD
jgi:hypothetical protein